MSLKDMQRFTEVNVARLALISVQERIPPTYTQWDMSFEVDGQPGHLSCFCPAEYGGVPHGLDGDIADALIDMFVEQGAPETGIVNTTASALLLHAGLHSNGHYHRVLTESMRRLQQATYTMSRAWRDHAQQRWTSGVFSFILAYDLVSSERATVTEGAVLAVTLAAQIVKSIRAQYVKPLDYGFLTSLERPLTRALYRLLDAKRHDPQNLTRVLPSYQVKLLVWAAECKIVDQRTDKVRRTLDRAHNELIKRGYLRTVTYEGRGGKQQLTYVFGTQTQDALEAPPALVSALMAQGVAQLAARSLVEKYGEARVTARLEKFLALLTTGYKARNLAGLLVDVINDDVQKYPDQLSPVSVPQQTRVHQTKQERKLHAADEAEEFERSYDAAFQQLPSEEQAERTIKTLKVLLQKRLDADQYSQLRSALETGRVDATTLTKLVTKAASENQMERAVQDLLTLTG